MKQIIAILIACFLFVNTSKVSAQEIHDFKEVNVATYEFAPTDTWVVFKKATVRTTCTLPDAKTNKGRVLHLLNRSNNAMIISHPSLSEILANYVPTLILPFNQAMEFYSDGIGWFVLTRSSVFPESKR